MDAFDKDQIALRHTLHAAAELAFNEHQTASIVADYLRPYAPDRLIEGLGRTGLAAVYEGQSPGPRVLIRAELDALPIAESIPLAYGSQHPGVAHKCGHDGHMAMVAGLAPWLRRNRPRQGAVILLFQPAEETGQGAAQVLADPKMDQLAPTEVYALHNLPGVPRGTVVLRKNVFAAASLGLIIELHGACSHASEPQHGRSPALAVAHLIEALSAAPQFRTALPEPCQVTVIHARLGEPAFGTSPGYGTVMATLRAYSDPVLAELTDYCERLAQGIGWAHGLTVTVRKTDAFPSTVNDDIAVERVQQACKKMGLSWQWVEHPFPWSEDFAHFTKRYPGALFGLGLGAEQKPLHDEAYDFPDRVLPIGTELFRHLIGLLDLGIANQPNQDTNPSPF